MNKLLAIRLEYGEPFVDVVQGFAKMGYSRRATADVLGVNLSYFRALCKRFDLHKHFLPQAQMRQECRGGVRMGGNGWPKGKARPRGVRYSDEQLLEEVRRIPDYSCFRTMASVDASTVQNRFGTFARARSLAFAGDVPGVRCTLGLAVYGTSKRYLEG
jgi:hypothetical protein